jgi:peptide/nickel transport system permease protein
MSTALRNFLVPLTRSRAGLLGIVILMSFIVVAAIAPWIAPSNPLQTNLSRRFAAPSLTLTAIGSEPLGRDQLGRDILSRMIYGSRVTLLIAAAAVVLGGLVGIALGLLAGYQGGLCDQILMRIVDVQLAFPLMLLALIVVAAIGPNLLNLVIVLALTSWTRYARIVRGEVLALREREFVLSAVAAGARAWRIAVRHILPNIMAPIVVLGTLELARVIVLEAALSFLGVGIQPPAPSWGRMLAEGRGYVVSAWWLATFPGLAIMLVVLSINLIGDFLRDTFDPRQRGRP